MSKFKDALIEAEDRLGVDHLPAGWYVVDSSFQIGAGPFSKKEEAEKRIVTSSERAEFIDY